MATIWYNEWDDREVVVSSLITPRFRHAPREGGCRCGPYKIIITRPLGRVFIFPCVCTMGNKRVSRGKKRDHQLVLVIGVAPNLPINVVIGVA